MKTEDARHSQKSCEWGTPPWVCDLARDVMGGIDLDPSSDAKWNETVKATRFYTEADDGLVRRWSGRVFLNPPGAGRGAFKRWWEKLLVELGTTSEIVHFFLVGYNLDHLRNPGMEFFTCIVPHKRVNYIGAGKSAGAGSFFLTSASTSEAKAGLKRALVGANVFRG